MSKKKSENIDASVRQRLLNLSRERNEDFNLMLTRYAVERFLYRLSKSEHSDKFVLKGAMLTAFWIGEAHRPTRDLDLLGFGNPEAEDLKAIIREICQVEVEKDGLEFDTDSVEIEEIRGNQEYPGQRLRINARLGNAKIRIQVDVGFGDAVTPKAKIISYPVLLDFPAPRIRAYNKETQIAEKLQAMVFLGMANSRMKDFYDIFILSKTSSFDGMTLVKAIKETFKRRGTHIPEDKPLALSGEFANSTDKINQWKAFINRSNLDDFNIDFPQLIQALGAFLLEPLHAAGVEESFNNKWTEHRQWE
ncbi:MAG: nucleotidyl transferase AbiEii/AbiGii toxin family protein [candidate division Zixibacteria bacterium]|nr:nucleotidyl transferase AbiEii/AbiGii toxin family protein [candidate division Zixibacteria bacterium]